MYFKYCLQKNIRARVKNAYFHVADFTLVYGWTAHPKNKSHSKFCRYFNFRNDNVEGFFDGGLFDGESAYLQIVVDLKTAIFLVCQEGGPRSLLAVLDNLVHDLEMMPLSGSVA